GAYAWAAAAVAARRSAAQSTVCSTPTSLVGPADSHRPQATGTRSGRHSVRPTGIGSGRPAPARGGSVGPGVETGGPGPVPSPPSRSYPSGQLDRAVGDVGLQVDHVSDQHRPEVVLELVVRGQ